MSNHNSAESLSSMGKSSPSHDEVQTFPVGKIITSGDGGEFVVIGRQKFYKHELMHAFGGTLNPGLAPPPSHNIANPSPLGLSAFAFTTFVLSMINAQAMGVKVNNVVVGSAFFYGGLVQFLAGCWEIGIGNTFAGCALSSYGAFWASFASIFVPGFGIAAAYEDPVELSNAVGFFLIGWMIFTFLLVLVTIRSTWAFFLLFFCLCLTFLLLACGEFTGHVGVARAGGVVGVITAFLGWYNAYAGIANPSNSYLRAVAIPLPGAE